MFFILLCSCNRTINKTNADFSIIEITEYNGWTGGSTIHIDSLGIITVCDYHAISTIDSAKCYVDTLNYRIVDTLNYYSNKLIFEETDSLYDGHCEDCGGYHIKIVRGGRILKSMIIGRNEFSNDVSNFADFVTSIKIDKNVIDSVMIFETTKILIPPPFPPGIKFYPPENENKY
jgi:hypothetical protein